MPAGLLHALAEDEVSNGDTITVTLSRRAYSPVLRQSSLPAETTIPWWHNHRLRFQFS